VTITNHIGSQPWSDETLQKQGARIQEGQFVKLTWGTFVSYLAKTADGLVLTSDQPEVTWVDPKVAKFRALWEELLAGAETPEARLDLARSMLTKLGCGPCKTHWRAVLRDTPPDVSTADGFHRWVWERRNDIAVSKGREPLPYPVLVTASSELDRQPSGRGAASIRSLCDASSSSVGTSP